MSKVTAKYQITIPVDIRKELNIVPGCEVDIKKESGRYVLLVNPIEGVKKKWRGKFKGAQTTVDYLDEIRGRLDAV